MKTVISLTDGWTLRALGADAGSPASALPDTIPATVPGTVHTDLLAASLIDDPYLDLNELKDAWIGHTRWSYRTSFEWEPVAGEHVELVFEGLDTIATVLVNGTEIARTANQHRTYRIDVADVVRAGANELEVVFDSAWEYAERARAEHGDLPNAYPTPFHFIRKMAANFGWDWGPQLVTAGIWKPARIERWSTARLRDPRVIATVDGSTGTVRVIAEIDAPVDLGQRLVVEVAGIRREVAAPGGPIDVSVGVPDVDLWWPVGMGEQPLYPVHVALVADEGEGEIELDSWQRRVGFRTIELDTSEDAEGSAFTFVVNGSPIFVRGANWIPDDCFPSRLTEERYRERVEQAIGANLNLLRIWGGGIYERDEFYDVCDELGVLVWQDFLFACAAYPEEQPLWDEVAAEARDNVSRLTGHASLALWDGCNENIWGYFDWDWQESIGDRTWGLGYYTRLLPEIVAELDPSTPYWAGSPFSGSLDIHPNDQAHGNVHLWEVWNRIDYTNYAEYTPRFVSEFGFQGPPTWSTLTASIHDVPLTPESPGMLLHQKADDGNGKLARGMAPHLPEPRSMEEWHYLTQLNQARAIVFGIERFRSQRPRCMGTVVWQLNDCWPVTSWAAVDGYGRRKPLWHGLRRSNEERLATLQPQADGSLGLVAVNDGVEPWEFAGEIQRVRLDGTVAARATFALAIGALSQEALTVPAEVFATDEPAREVIVVISDGRRDVVRPFVEDRELALAPVAVEVRGGEWTDGVQEVVVSTDAVARGVSLFPDRVEHDAWVDDLDLDVFPGRPVTVRLHTPRPLSDDELSATLRTLNELVVGAPVGVE